MKRLLIGVTVAATMLTSSLCLAEEVLMVTWLGKLVSEKHFEKFVKEKHPNVNFTYIHANRKKSTLAKALRSHDMSKVDLVYSFGTTGTKIVKEYLRGSKPHVFNIVTAPVLSGIADSIEKPGNNLTGAKYLVDLELQIGIPKKLKDFKTLAVWYDPREKQNQIVLNGVKKLGTKMGFSVKTFRIIPDGKGFADHLKKASEESNKLDALYIVGSSSYTDFYNQLHAQLDPKLMVIGTVSPLIKAGATIAISANWEERSKSAAELASQILKGAKAGDLPITQITQDNVDVYVNKNRHASVGLKGLDTLKNKIVYMEEDKK